MLLFGIVMPVAVIAKDAQENESVASAPEPIPIHEPQWFDEWHMNFEDAMNITAQSIDSFFALSGDSFYQEATTSGRVRIGWEPRSRDFAEMDLRFRVRVRLPALENRVDLLLTDHEDDLQENSVKAARNNQLSRRDQATLALRFRRSPDAKVSHRIGAGRRDQVFVKSRYLDHYDFNPDMAIFYDAEVYYYSRDRLGGELGLSYQHLLSEHSLARLNNRYYYRDKTNDWRWRHEAQYLSQVNDTSTYIYTLFVEGLSRPNMQTEQVFLSARWRTNPTREWLFYEVEPFVLWLKEEDFKPSFGVALRLEVFYGKI